MGLMLPCNVVVYEDDAGKSIPYLAVFRNGAVVHQQPGFAPRADMRRWIETSS